MKCLAIVDDGTHEAVTVHPEYVPCGGHLVGISWSVEIWSPNRRATMGGNVQFGKNCIVNCDNEFGNVVLIARNVGFVGRDDHTFDHVGLRISDSP